MSYCEFTKDLDVNHPHRVYHDNYYGYPIKDDDELFGRLILEINQAGLNWLTILNKEQNFRAAFDKFSIERIAQYDQFEIDRLMQNKGIIRNKLKIEAVIFNAKRVKEIQLEFGSFKEWLNKNTCENLAQWTAVFKRNFKFTGGLIVEEFLMSTGYLKGAHQEDCEVYKKILKLEPIWKIN